MTSQSVSPSRTICISLVDRLAAEDKAAHRNSGWYDRRRRLWTDTLHYLVSNSFFNKSLKSNAKLSWFGHVCRLDTLQKIILQRTVDGIRRRGRPGKSWKEWPGQSMSSFAAHRRRQKSMVSYHSGDICWSTLTTSRRHGN